MLVLAGVALSAWSARGGPVGGSWSKFVELEDTRPAKQLMAFRGNERAAVLAVGDRHDPAAKLHIAVYDAKGTLVAEDKSDTDFAGVVWYPPRDEEYRIEISQSGAGASQVYVAIK